MSINLNKYQESQLRVAGCHHVSEEDAEMKANAGRMCRLICEGHSDPGLLPLARTHAEGGPRVLHAGPQRGLCHGRCRDRDARSGSSEVGIVVRMSQRPSTKTSQHSAASDSELWPAMGITQSVATPGLNASSNFRVSIGTRSWHRPAATCSRLLGASASIA